VGSEVVVVEVVAVDYQALKISLAVDINKGIGIHVLILVKGLVTLLVAVAGVMTGETGTVFAHAADAVVLEVGHDQGRRVKDRKRRASAAHELRCRGAGDLAIH
jgi:hypothetical protein